MARKRYLFESEEYAREADLEEQYEKGQEHGSKGRSGLTGGWLLNDEQSLAWEKGFENGRKNQPKS